MFENIGTIKKYKDGEIIFRENQPGKNMYMIESGEVKITRTNLREGQDIISTLAILKEGDFFGEMALFDYGPRSATAKAVSDIQVKVISRSDLQKQIKANPNIAFYFLDKISKRMRNTNELIELLLVREQLAKDIYDKVDALRYPEFI